MHIGGTRAATIEDSTFANNTAVCLSGMCSISRVCCIIMDSVEGNQNGHKISYFIFSQVVTKIRIF